MPAGICIMCKGAIETMAFKGTIVCSDGCRKALVESIPNQATSPPTEKAPAHTNN